MPGGVAARTVPHERTNFFSSSSVAVATTRPVAVSSMTHTCKRGTRQQQRHLRAGVAPGACGTTCCPAGSSLKRSVAAPCE
jgi:hypothetical protein